MADRGVDTAGRLSWTTASPDPSAVVLVLHGGRESSTDPVRGLQPAVLRMLPFAWSVAKAGRGRIAVARLIFGVQGWNGVRASPVADAELALEQVAARHPGVPVGLLGHSMGGRVALRVADDERVAAIAALAPWVTPSDRPHGHPGLQALLMHGTADRVTSPSASRRMAQALEGIGVRTTWRAVEGENHAMLRRAGLWHRTSAEFLRDALLPDQAIHDQAIHDQATHDQVTGDQATGDQATQERRD